MRPIKKWKVGDSDNAGNTIVENYNPHRSAYQYLHSNIDCFCSFCEVFSSDLEVEHVISQHQDGMLSYKWDNFLLSCGRCNGKDNKSNKPIDFSSIYMPHLNNTLLALSYLEGGIIVPHGNLTIEQSSKSVALIKLIGLDKYPGNPTYPNGFPNGDRRWEHRRSAWELATIKLNEYTAGIISASDVALFAKQRGFFSIWFNIFSMSAEVKKALVEIFTGTDTACFDNQYSPIPRNPNNNIDNL